MVDELLRAVALVAGREGSAGRLWVLARLEPRRLCVVVHVVHDHAPLALHVAGTLWHRVRHVAGADVAFGTCGNNAGWVYEVWT